MEQGYGLFSNAVMTKIILHKVANTGKKRNKVAAEQKKGRSEGWKNLKSRN
jgi:hypothetical protein